MHPELLLLIGISLSLGFTPGPNNAVAAYSGFNFGIRKTLPLILGVGFGYTTLIILIIWKNKLPLIFLIKLTFE